MRVLGIVQWTTRKGGTYIAGVRPLFELQKIAWRPIDAAEEFPSHGQVFWPNAQSATEGALVIFRAEPNPGQKDEFRVVEPRFAHEVIDLRSVGNAEEVRAALDGGAQVPGYIGATRVLVWCAPDDLVGPVELTRLPTGPVKLSGVNLARLPFFTGVQVKPVIVDGTERLLRVDDGAPAGYVDWDNDAKVLRRALEAAVRVLKQAGRNTGHTKRQIEDAARALSEQGVGLDAQLDRYRLGRALELVEHTEVVARQAAELAELLREHPAIEAALEKLSAELRVDVERSARANLEELLATESAALIEKKQAHARLSAQLNASEMELRKLEERVVEVRRRAEMSASEVEAAVDARVLAAINRPFDLLAEVSVLRPLLGVPGSGLQSSAVRNEKPRIGWSASQIEAIKDRASLRRTLTGVARARGVDPSVMLQVHAAMAAGLMPVVTGFRSLAAIAAYAHGACGGRLLVMHVTPSIIQPREFDEMPGGGLLAAATAAKDVDGLSLVVLEGANRSPLESSLVPLLQLADAGLSPISSARGLRFAATLVAGATTVPVTSQLWNHAAAIHCEPSAPSQQTEAVPGDLNLSSDLLALGDVPSVSVEAILDTWPDCRELRSSLERFGSALTRFYDEEPRITDALLHGIVLPYVVTALSVEEQAEILNSGGDADGELANALRRLRKRLC